MHNKLTSHEEFKESDNEKMGDIFDEEFEGDEEDSWSDEDEFEEEGGIINFDKGKMGNVKKQSLNDKDCVPVFPDGRPRTRW